MQIVCDDRHSRVILDDYLQTEEPLVVCVEPFQQQRQVHLLPWEMPQQEMFASYAQQGKGQVRWATQFKELGTGAHFLLLFDGAKYTAFFCLSHGEITATLTGRSEDLVLQLRSRGPGGVIRPALIVVRGEDLNLTIRRAILEGLKGAGSLGQPLAQKGAPPDWLHSLSLSICGSLSHSEILDRVTALQAKGCQFSSLLIEEEVDEERFPSGLRGLSVALKELGVRRLGVRHPLVGAPIGLGDAFQFFYAYYEGLKAEGVSFVEVSEQHKVTSDGTDLGIVYRNLHVAQQAAASTQFNTAVLECDCMENSCLFYWTTARTAQTGATTIREHLAISLWLRHLMQPDPGPLCDNDEGQALLRALTGPPLRVAPNIEPRLLRRLALPSGRTLRADTPPTLTRDLLFEADGPIKAFVLASGCGVVGAWNPTPSEQQIPISPVDLPIRAERFALHSDKQGFLGVVEGVHVTPLPPGGCDIFTLSPIDQGIALLGHPHFFLMPGAIGEWHRDEESVHISSQICGPLLVYCEHPILEVRRGTEVVPWSHERERSLLTIEPDAEPREVPSLYTISFE